MRRLFVTIILFLALFTPSAPVHAQSSTAPLVTTDIAPVQSLVAMVMGDLGAPALILPANASPHSHSMRPSEARALARAQLVVWVGPELTPWLSGTLERLAQGARILTLRDVPGTTVMPLRASPDLGNRIADHTDPHMWLDPENAALWLDAIAQALADLDPENAAAYHANAAVGRAAVLAAEDRARALLGPIKGMPILMDHDWVQYFQARFDLNVIGALADSEDTRPGPGRLLTLARLVSRIDGTLCILAEPPVNVNLFRPVLGNIQATITEADPIGAGLAPGAGLYPALIMGLAQSIASCAPAQ